MQPSSPFDALELADFTVWAGHVECTLTVDEPATERAYRVTADYQVEAGAFEDVAVRGVWTTELDERPLADRALSEAIARYLDAHELTWLREGLARKHSDHWDDVRAYDRLDARGLL